MIQLRNSAAGELVIHAGDSSIEVCANCIFSELVLEFFNELSQMIRKSEEARKYPDLLTFAFWCRKGNLEMIKRAEEYKHLRLGRGMIFHIAPSNVPTSFAYSFCLALLAGNSNIVRISTKKFPQSRLLCELIQCLFNQQEYDCLKRRNAIVTYERNTGYTSLFSSMCNGRIIWGGSNTVAMVKKEAIPERSIDLVFPDRHSFSVIHSGKYNELGKKEKRELAQKFYNDTYLMDQNACSSPHVLVWIDSPLLEQSKKEFWDELAKAAKSYRLEDVKVVDKYTDMCQGMIEGTIRNVKNIDNRLYVFELSKWEQSMDHYRGKYGSFFEISISRLSEMIDYIEDKEQTITYFGIDKVEWMKWISGGEVCGIDRIVPIGQALDMGHIWDGFDIITQLSRIIDIQ